MSKKTARATANVKAATISVDEGVELFHATSSDDVFVPRGPAWFGLKKKDVEWYGSRILLFTTTRSMTLMAAATQDDIVETLRGMARGKKADWGTSAAAKWLCKQRSQVDGWYADVDGAVMLCHPDVVFVDEAGAGRR